MLEIFKSMMKEEWRIHSSLFGGMMFALFPIILMIIVFVGSLLIPTLSMIIPISQMLLIFQYTFILFGLSVGSFGMLGKEVMNRRFGHASLIAYSSRSLPVSEKSIFANFFVKDIIYYFFLWILPFVLGFTFALPFLSISLVYSLSLLLILTLSFLMGLSVVFLLSTIYAHSSRLLISVIIVLLASSILAINYFSINLSSLYQLSFSLIPSLNQILLSLFIIIIPSALSFMFLKVDYPQKKRLYKNSLDKLSNELKFGRYSTIMSKDFLDFNRSEGGIGKIIFSFLIPLAVIWILISILLRFIPVLNQYVVFSIFMGIISSSFYNWFTEFDSFASYAFMPVKTSTLMKSKIGSYMLINLISLAVLVITALWSGQTYYLLPSLFSFMAVSSFTLSVTIYLSGLNPNLLLYNAKIFSEYLLLITPLLLVFIFLSMVSPLLLIASPILIPVSYKIIKASFKKWDRSEQLVF